MTDELDSLRTKLIRNQMLSAALDVISPQIYSSLMDSFSLMRELMPSEFPDLPKKALAKATKELLTRHEESLSLDNMKRLWLEIILSQHVQAFDYYIVQILTKIYSKRHELLNSSEHTVKMSEVLQCGSINEIIQRVAERKVQQLSYKGLSDIFKYLNQNLGLSFDVNAPDFINACEIFQTRNIIVHNNSFVNEIYLQNTIRKDLKVNTLYPITEVYVANSFRTFLSLGHSMDKAFITHFAL